jgi:membrane protease YdiL (CAAX protease family)
VSAFDDSGAGSPVVSIGSGGYSRRLLLTVWVLATLPMVVLTWAVAPWLISRSRLPAAPAYFLLSALGLLWQGVLGWWLLSREGTGFTRQGLRRRLWLAAPTHPRTRQRRRRAWLIVVPLTVVAALTLLLANAAVSATMMFRFLREPSWSRFFPGYAKSFGLMSPELAGQWWLLAAVPLVALVALMSEELLFRGLLLPRMGSQRISRGWLANALLYALYHVYQPWMIPPRLLATIGVTWAAERYRSNWIPILVRLSEVAGLTLATAIGVSSFTFPVLPESLELPYVQRRPAATIGGAKTLKALPVCNPARPHFSVDLRGRDLSALDLRARAADLECAAFDARTAWPPPDRLPAGFDPGRVLEANRNPGLGLHALHARGVTGCGVGIGIIDSPLLTEHREYASQLRWYEELEPMHPFRWFRQSANFHGGAVASIAVGQSTGVAPGADLYFVATSAESPKGVFLTTHFIAQGIRRIVEINRRLPAERKIRAISLSFGWGDAAPGFHDAEAAVATAKAEGIAFFSVNHGFRYGGLSRPPLADPDSFEDLALAWMWRDNPYGRLEAGIHDLFYIPIDRRTVASETGSAALVHYSVGGFSFGPPFIVGLYALAAQVDPTITPDRFFDTAVRLARRREVAAQDQRKTIPILDPAALIAELAGDASTTR